MKWGDAVVLFICVVCVICVLTLCHVVLILNSNSRISPKRAGWSLSCTLCYLLWCTWSLWLYNKKYLSIYLSMHIHIHIRHRYLIAIYPQFHENLTMYDLQWIPFHSISSNIKIVTIMLKICGLSHQNTEFCYNFCWLFICPCLSVCVVDYITTQTFAKRSRTVDMFSECLFISTVPNQLDLSKHKLKFVRHT